MTGDQNSDAPSEEQPVNDSQTRPQRPTIKVDPAHVPPELHPLIPYAEKWGIEDEELLNRLLDKASTQELEELDKAVLPFLKAIDSAVLRKPLFGTPETRKFRLLVRAKRRGWLKTSGWPDNYPNPRINPDHVPPKLHPLILYAEKWGFPDRELHRYLLQQAPVEEIQEMYETVYPLWNDIWNFIRSDPSSDDPTSYEVSLFRYFYHSFSDAYNILSDAMPNRLLEIIGYPERWPPLPFDPTIIPAELQHLIPYIERWVIADQGVRDTVLQAATNAELEGLIIIINQMGDQVIRDLAFKIDEHNETKWEESYALLMLLDVAERAESLLRNRPDSRSP